MGIAKLVNIQDLMQGNERICLSANRVFNRCHECPEYEKKVKKADGTFRIKICESRIENPDAIRQIREKEELEEQLKDIKKRLKEMSQ